MSSDDWRGLELSKEVMEAVGRAGERIMAEAQKCHAQGRAEPTHEPGEAIRLFGKSSGYSDALSILTVELASVNAQIRSWENQRSREDHRRRLLEGGPDAE